MIEDVFNLGLALANVAITLLDPMLQLANGVVIMQHFELFFIS